MEQLNNIGNNFNQPKKPMGFGKTLLASTLGVIIGTAIINIIVFVLMISAIASMATMKTEEVPIVGDNIFLKIDLTQGIMERSPDALTSITNELKVTGLDQIVESLKKASNDDKINGIYLYSGATTSISWGQCEEIRNALLRFKNESSKPIIAYAESYSQSGYYISTIADSIIIHPSGITELCGIGSNVIFYKELLDKLDIKMDLIRPNNNAYKSAGETYTRTNMSEANREQLRSYISSIWDHISQQIATSRNIDIDRLNSLTEDMRAFLPEDALRHNIISGIAFEQEIEKMLKQDYTCSKIVDITRYAKKLTQEEQNDRIAIIYAEGDVLSGHSNSMQTAVYGDDIVDALTKATKDDNIKAIVLRVNSPGGAVTASESMTHAVIEARKVKPVIVSMSGMAASAGYEISSNATAIVAHPTTLTGSIGVFAALPEVGSMLRNKLGITIDTVGTHTHSTEMSGLRPLSPTARNLMQRKVEEFYDTFCVRVATGRNLTPEYVDEIARGRVWTGAEALKIGLVDTLGGLDLALEMAAQYAGIENYSITQYPEQKDFVTILSESIGNREDRQLKTKLNAIIPFYSELEYWSTMEPFQARLPYAISF